jgi:WD40 repeat protein
MAKSRLVLAVLLSYGTFAPFLHAFVVSTYHHQGNKASFGIVIPQNSQRWHFSKGAPSRCCCHHGRPQLLSLQKDNDNDEEEREEVLFDDFDFTIGEAAASPEQSSSTPPRQLQERIRQVQQELIRKDSQLTKNWSLGNWRVRGFSLDKWNAKDREDEILRNEHSSSLVHVCRLVQAGPDCVIVGRTDGSVLLVLLGDEYLTKFTSKLTAKQQQDDTIQIQSELVRSEQESMNDNQEVLVAEPFQVLRQFQAHEQELSAMAEVEHFEGDQRLLFTAAKGSGEIRVWGLPEDDDDKVVPLRSLVEVHSDTVVSLKVLSLQPEEDPNLLFSASLDGTIALWEMATGDLVYKCQLMIKGERQSILCADVDSEKAMLYLGTASGQVVCFLVEAMVQCASTGEEQCPIPNGRFQAHDAAVTAIQHAGDGTLARSRPGTLSSILLTGGEDGVVKQW